MVLLLCTKTTAHYIGCNWDKIETNVCFPRVVKICQALKFLVLIVPECVERNLFQKTNHLKSRISNFWFTYFLVWLEKMTFKLEVCFTELKAVFKLLLYSEMSKPLKSLKIGAKLAKLVLYIPTKLNTSPKLLSLN